MQKSEHVRVFVLDGSVWMKVGGDIDGEAAYAEFGYQTFLSSDSLVISSGAPNNCYQHEYKAGHVRVIELVPYKLE